MATLTPTLTLTSTDATTDQISFSVTDSLSVKHPQVGLSKVAATTTGGDTIILPSVDTKRYLYLKHTGLDTSGSAVTTTLNVESADNTVICILHAGEFMFAPIHDGNATLTQLEASSGTIVAEYAYFSKA